MGKPLFLAAGPEQGSSFKKNSDKFRGKPKGPVLGITIDFQKKIAVNGREYDSWEEVPEEVRRLVGGASGPPSPGGSKQPIVFNGREYADLSLMPEEERRLLESILETLKTAGEAPPQARALKGRESGPKVLTLNSYRRRKPDSPSLVSRLLLGSLVAVALLWAVYRLLQ